VSFKAVASVIDADAGSATLKLILILMADHASDDGERIYPSVGTIARRAEVSERTVQYAIKELVRKGLLEVAQERTGATTIYRIPPQNLHRGGATVAPKPISNLSVKPITLSSDDQDFIERVKSEYPKKKGEYGWKKAEPTIKRIPKKDREAVIAGVIGYRKFCETERRINTTFVKHAPRFFNAESWLEYQQSAPVEESKDPVQGIHYDLVMIAGEQVKVYPGSDELFDEDAWRSA